MVAVAVFVAVLAAFCRIEGPHYVRDARRRTCVHDDVDYMRHVVDRDGFAHARCSNCAFRTPPLKSVVVGKTRQVDMHGHESVITLTELMTRQQYRDWKGKQNARTP